MIHARLFKREIFGSSSLTHLLSAFSSTSSSPILPLSSFIVLCIYYIRGRRMEMIMILIICTHDWQWGVYKHSLICPKMPFKYIGLILGIHCGSQCIYGFSTWFNEIACLILLLMQCLFKEEEINDIIRCCVVLEFNTHKNFFILAHTESL